MCPAGDHPLYPLLESQSVYSGAMKTITATSIVALTLATLAACGQTTDNKPAPTSAVQENKVTNTAGPTDSSKPRKTQSSKPAAKPAQKVAQKPAKKSARPVAKVTPVLAPPDPKKASTKQKTSTADNDTSDNQPLYITGLDFSPKPWGERITVELAGDTACSFRAGFVEDVDFTFGAKHGKSMAGNAILELKISGLAMPKNPEVVAKDAHDLNHGYGTVAQTWHFLPMSQGASHLYFGMDDEYRFSVVRSQRGPERLYIDIFTSDEGSPAPTSKPNDPKTPGDVRMKKTKGFPAPLSDAETYVESISRRTQPWGEQIQLRMSGKGRPAYHVRYQDSTMIRSDGEDDPEFTSKDILVVQLETPHPSDYNTVRGKAKAPKPQGLIQESHFSTSWVGDAVLNLGLAKKYNFTVEAPANSQTITINIYK